MIHALRRFFFLTVHLPLHNQNTEHILLAVNRNPDRRNVSIQFELDSLPTETHRQNHLWN